MLGKTHRAGGCAAALISFEIMRTQGWLLPDVNEFIQLAMMYPICSWASIAPDLDHGKDSIPDKDPVSILINKLLRLSGSKHRSWQTHSLLVTGGFCVLLYAFVFLFNAMLGVQNDIGWAYIRLATLGFISGIMSHLILDAFSTAGIHIYPGLKLRFVPKTSAFATGGKWEKFVFYTLIVVILVLVFKIGLSEFGVDIVQIIRNVAMKPT